MNLLLIDFNPFGAAATPISLGHIGAHLAGLGHRVRVVSLGSDSSFSIQRFRSWIAELAPDLVGFGAYQRNITHIHALALLVKEVRPGARVVFGGPQATFLPPSALSALPAVDHVCHGEGERVLEAIVAAMEEERLDEPIPGCTTRDPEGGWWTGPPVEPAQDLDVYPSPWLTGVLDPSTMDEAIMLGSRGCPFSCAFCYTPRAFGRRIRAHSVERVLEEVALVARKGSGRLWFADPNFSYSRSRVLRLLEGIARLDVAVSLWLETRADMLDRELIQLMKRAGVHTVAMGLESASPVVYERLNKRLEPGVVREAVKAALGAGLEVELFSQFALPHERKEDALGTLAFVKACGVPIRGNSNAQQMQVYFGSAIADDPGAFGVRPLRRMCAPFHAMGAEFETDWMTREEIREVREAWLAESLDGGKRVVS